MYYFKYTKSNFKLSLKLTLKYFHLPSTVPQAEKFTNNILALKNLLNKNYCCVSISLQILSSFQQISFTPLHDEKISISFDKFLWVENGEIRSKIHLKKHFTLASGFTSIVSKTPSILLKSKGRCPNLVSIIRYLGTPVNCGPPRTHNEIGVALPV